jgi:hypothetical protein
VWGISLALLEETQIDPRYGRAVNNNLAEYHVPVNADIADRRFGAEYCRSEVQSGLGARGIGAISIIGASGQWRTRCITPQASVHAICPSRSTSCWPELVGLGQSQHRLHG